MKPNHNRPTTPPPSPDAVEAACAALGIPLPPGAAPLLADYLALLTKWNRVMNLVGPGDWRHILDTLIIDSLLLAGFVRTLPLPEAPQCRDLGAGAGLPGIPLRMLWSEGAYTLVEAREKRALFLRAVLAACPLPGVSVFQGRAELFMANHPPAHLTISRAFMPWERVLSLISPHTDSGGVCVFLTLAPLTGELPADWKPLAEQAYPVGRDTRHFWAIRKR